MMSTLLALYDFMKNIQSSTFIDKCTARLHYELNGLQLHQLILEKCPEQYKVRFEKLLKRQQIHIDMLEAVLHRYGANPYALTPSAKATDREFHGTIKGARTSDFRQLMDTLFSVELVGTANWEFLTLLAKKVDDKEAHGRFSKVLLEKVEHLRFIQQYIMKDLTGKTTKRPAIRTMPKKSAPRFYPVDRTH